MSGPKIKIRRKQHPSPKHHNYVLPSFHLITFKYLKMAELSFEEK